MFKKILLATAITLIINNMYAADNFIVPSVDNPTIQANSSVIIDDSDRHYVSDSDTATVFDPVEKFYVTYNIGYSQINYYPAYLYDVPSTTSTGSPQYGLGLDLGYKYNQFLALELGYVYFFNFFKQQGDYLSNATNVSLRQQNTNAVLIDGKLTLPLGLLISPLKNWAIYGKAGGAYVWSTLQLQDSLGTSNQITSQLHPMYGAGIAYNINKHLMMAADWTSIMGSTSGPTLYAVEANGSIGSFDTPPVNFFALSISYAFNFGSDSRVSSLEDKPLS